MTTQNGPFGELRGMSWDPIRSRYFPNPRPTATTPTPALPQSSVARPSLSLGETKQGRRKRSKKDSDGGVAGQAGPGPSTVAHAAARVPKPRLRFIQSRILGQNRESHIESAEKDIWSNLVKQHETRFFSPGSKITHIHPNWGDFEYLVGTENRELDVRPKRKCDPHGATYVLNVEPWTHPTFGTAPKGFSVRGTCNVEEFIPGGITEWHSTFQRPIPNSGTSSAHGPRRYHPMPICFSSYEKSLTVGSGPSIIRFDFSQGRPWQSLLYSVSQSDILALHQVSHDIVYAGLRNSGIGLGDFRVSNGIIQPIATTGRKAITSVKRLQDSAVPFGLLASGMGDQLVLFDIRFGDRPLRTFQGHVNPYYSDLGITTTLDDQIVFAGGGDRRIRAWSLLDSQRLLPPETETDAGDDTTNPLSYLFPYRPTAISVTGDGVMDVGVGESVYRFGIPGYVPHAEDSDSE